MRFGICSYAYTWSVGFLENMPSNPMDIFALINGAKQLNISLVQIADNINLADYSKEEIEKIADYGEFTGVSFEVGTRGLNNIKRYCHIAKRLKSSFVRTVIDNPNNAWGVEEIIGKIRALLPTLEEHNIILAIENHDHLPSQTIKDILTEINSSLLKVCLDTVNSIGICEGLKQTIQLLKPWVINVHLKDYTIYRPYHLMGFVVEGTPAGKGVLDICALAKEFGEATFVLELWTPPENSLDATIKKEQQWVKESVEAVKKLNIFEI